MFLKLLYIWKFVPLPLPSSFCFFCSYFSDVSVTDLKGYWIRCHVHAIKIENFRGLFQTISYSSSNILVWSYWRGMRNGVMMIRLLGGGGGGGGGGILTRSDAIYSSSLSYFYTAKLKHCIVSIKDILPIYHLYNYLYDFGKSLRRL